MSGAASSSRRECATGLRVSRTVECVRSAKTTLMYSSLFKLNTDFPQSDQVLIYASVGLIFPAPRKSCQESRANKVECAGERKRTRVDFLFAGASVSALLIIF
jgi:hypothetical protein